MRPELNAEALRLARLTAASVPGEAEAHGLAALRPVLLQHPARCG